MNFTGILVGLVTFLTIGIFHPIVIKAEYYWGKRCWWVFLVVGLITLGLSLLIDNVVLSTIVGVFSFSCFWSIHEIVEQEKRVERGWFPKNPKKINQ